jgi:hypothetical protein
MVAGKAKRSVSPPWYPISDKISHLLAQIEAFYKSFILDMTLLNDFAPQDYDEITAWYIGLQENRGGAFKTGPVKLMNYLMDTCIYCRNAAFTREYTDNPKDWVKAFFAELYAAYGEDVPMCCEVAARWRAPVKIKREEA